VSTQNADEMTPSTPEILQTPQTPQTPETPLTNASTDDLLANKPKEVKRTSLTIIDVNSLDDNELKRQLLKGDVFLKYSLSGQQHNRFVCVIDDFTEIVWKDPKKDTAVQNIKKDFRIKVDSILEVYAGQKTETFLRSGRAFRAVCCFSIITKDRTLDLECKTSGERDMWVKAFKLLVAK